MKRYANVIGFDDAPFQRTTTGNVTVVGAVFAGARLEGFLRGAVRRDGANATRELARLILESRFREHLQLVLLEGIALAGFNVVSPQELFERTNKPVLIVARDEPDFASIRRALLTKVRGGARKWRLIEKAGPMEKAAGLYVQRAGLSLDDARRSIERFAVYGRLPEPLRVAHVVASILSR